MSPPAPAFTFVVHALAPAHRVFLGVRAGRPLLMAGLSSGEEFDAVFPICELGIDGMTGVVVGSALDPEQMLSDQERALLRMERAVHVATVWAEERGRPLAAVGLGSLCAVVAGRGTALAERVEVPVTTGGAATAWALWKNAREATFAQFASGSPPTHLAVVGSRSPVGRVVASLLAEGGLPVRVDHKRTASALHSRGVSCATGADLFQGRPVVVGAGPTGGALPAALLPPKTVVVDVAIPATFTGPRPPGVVELAGEAVSLPATWRRDGWGQIYHLLAGYGPRQVFACVIEPLVLAASQRSRPFALGRALDEQTVREFGDAAAALGFAPRLAQGWRGLSPTALSARLARGV